MAEAAARRARPLSCDSLHKHAGDRFNSSKAIKTHKITERYIITMRCMCMLNSKNTMII